MALAGSDYEYMVKTWGRPWADRVTCEAKHGVPPGPLKARGCEQCAGYGVPGWVVEQGNWKKCECNPQEEPSE
jgi:hypothetical protein